MTIVGPNGRQIILSALIAVTGMHAEFAPGQETAEAPVTPTPEAAESMPDDSDATTEPETETPKRISEVLEEAAKEEDQAPDVTPDVADPGAAQEDMLTEPVAEPSDIVADQESEPPESDGSDKVTEQHSAQSVEADLVHSDEIKPAIFALDPLHSRWTGFYKFKANLNDAFSLQFTTDYSVLYQRASSTLSGEDSAASDVFRILGTWLNIGDRAANHGTLVWKTEVRNRLGGRPTPREMGFDTGSALSTANYKEDDWGFTDLYWRQRFRGGQYGFIIGHMDPGDWADQYPLLNAWTSFTNDAFYNNPAQAIPSRGFGVVGQAFITDNVYTMVGVTDANGPGSGPDFSSFFDEKEWFSWVELGYRGGRDIMSKQNIHLNIWHQDARQAAGTEESWGLAFTHSVTLKNGAVPFVRLGYSHGDAAPLRRFVGVGIAARLFDRDLIGAATSWGSPPDKTARSQFTSEFFYRLQLTQHITLSPNIHFTYKPSFNLAKDWITVIGLRFRLAL